MTASGCTTGRERPNGGPTATSTACYTGKRFGRRPSEATESGRSALNSASVSASESMSSVTWRAVVLSAFGHHGHRIGDIRTVIQSFPRVSGLATAAARDGPPVCIGLPELTTE